MKKSVYLTASVIFFASSILSPLASAQSLSTALEACRQQQNALQRLVCYDDITLATTATQTSAANSAPPPAQQLTAKRQTSLASAAVAAPAQATPAAPEVVTADDFGQEHKKSTPEDQAKLRYMTVTEVSLSPRNELIVTFDNGQIWRQNGSGYYKIESGEQHYIKRGLFNSFSLGNDNNNRSVKVNRVQ
ncbi:hypothetical protein VT06_11270 [Arsukibacterium sp. MJ3]|uniref:hypothetical protein n=1 Tax=Arsukibacterium sp. MJ3 TaxID=1632859 RepID=UPI000626FF0C|nr:hypothetical protein [Arsukibacterium sp. MJ3]KKO48463.1 hypothetical protein VT06_11270 [Arsukibacterium sp. MJ3]